MSSFSRLLKRNQFKKCPLSTLLIFRLTKKVVMIMSLSMVFSRAKKNSVSFQDKEFSTIDSIGQWRLSKKWE